MRHFVTSWVWLTLGTALTFAADPQWTGTRQHRILVRVPPQELGTRLEEELIVSFSVDFPQLLTNQHLAGQFNPASLQVHRYHPLTGQVQSFQQGDLPDRNDIPCRFDDTTSLRSDLDRIGSSSEVPDGTIRPIPSPRKARIFNRLPQSTRGQIVWPHRQKGNAPGIYAIYFDLLPEQAPLPPSPAPWIGDADVLRRPQGESLGGFAHFTTSAGDLNGDGLFDIVAGTEKGELMWFPNRGRPGEPRFEGCILPEDQAGPMDAGWYAAPFLVDWNRDGRLDLLAGTRRNVIVWWKNVGTKTEPRWEHAGFVKVGQARLEVPETPVAEDTNGIFKHDYYNQPWVGDLNADGIPDIVTGGYTTGRIFFFRGTGWNPDGTPLLAPPLPVEADGAPIDTIWAAAPTLHDCDADGLPDLITGTWFWSGIHRPPQPGEGDFLAYYKNIGTSSAPKFTRQPFPKLGAFPAGNIARPTTLDSNGDGLVDLLVNDGGGNVYLFQNRGTPDHPRWDTQSARLTIPWGFTTDFEAATDSKDLDQDDIPELLMGTQLAKIRGGRTSPRIQTLGPVKTAGAAIHHPGPGYGDDYLSTLLHDWDRDGHTDLLWGTHQGEIYLHRKLPGMPPVEFAAGVRIAMTDGNPLQVGPKPVKSAQEVPDFRVLQGSRIVFNVVDFDRDGEEDVIVTETYRQLWLFRGIRQNGERRLAPGIKLLDLRTESLQFTDWNQDGLPDLLLGGPYNKPGLVCLNTTQPGRPSLGHPQEIKLPYLFWGAKLRAADWNRDGDDDLLIQSEFLSFYAERSFVQQGYISALLSPSTDEGSPIESR